MSGCTVNTGSMGLGAGLHVMGKMQPVVTPLSQTQKYDTNRDTINIIT